MYTGVVSTTHLTPRDALRMHADVADRIAIPGGRMHDAVGSFAGDHFADAPSGPPIANTVRTHLTRGRTYHVAPDLLALARRRADAMVDTATVEKDGMPPFAMGWCVFAVPLELTELRGRMVKHIAFSWGPARAARSRDALGGGLGDAVSGRFITLWGNAVSHPDEVHASLSAHYPPGVYDGAIAGTGGWTPTTMDFIAHGQRLGARIITPGEDEANRARRDGDEPYDGYNWRRIIVALWGLMGETRTTATTTEHVDRPTMKLARRAKIGTDITVITLRRQAREVIHPGSGTPLQYRVPVDGHHRTYHRGTPAEFSIWINDYERGPKDAPYRANKKVVTLAR